MRLVAIMPVRSEDWVIGLTARAVLMWCDGLVVLDHASTDNTRQILCDIAGEVGHDRIVWFDNQNAEWREMAHRQFLLQAARGCQATHIAYVDADEILTGNLLPTIRTHIERLYVGEMLSLPWLQLKSAPDQVMSSGMWSQQLASTAFRDSPELHWSSAGRGGYDFHQREPLGRSWAHVEPVGRHRRTAGMMHLQFLSERRLHAKQALYQCQEVLRWPGRSTVDQIKRTYCPTVYEARAALTQPTPAEWWEPYRHLLPHLRIDAEPWQESEVKRLWQEHGPEKFAGLDLFGVV